MYTITYTYDQTVLNPKAFAFVFLMAVLILFINERNVLIPIILTGCFITEQQRISIMGLDFNMMRILILILIFRVKIKNEWKIKKFNKIDKAYIIYTIFNVLLNTILYGTLSSFINRLGFAFDNLGMYLIARNYIFDIKILNSLTKWLIFSSILVAAAMTYEQLTSTNLFSALGGVPETTFLREGKLRSQGAFSHPIMAGSFGASLLPLVWGYMWQEERKKIVIIIGFVTSVAITTTSNSSGPLFTLIASLLAISLWPLRNKMSLVRRTSVFILIVLELVMTAHVWQLMTRASLVSGSTSYHRFMVIDAAIENFSRWFLIGSLDFDTWGPRDLTNNYIAEGYRGGLLNLIFFIFILVQCYKYLGLTRNNFCQMNLKKYSWALGAALFAHNVSFMGASYFGQMLFFYYLLIAMISSLGDISLKEAEEKNPPEEST